MRIVMGTRGSRLALWQANWVREQLVKAGHEVEIRVIKTTGDRLPGVPLQEIGTKELFIKEIEEALAAGSVHLAVHSLKDMPANQPAGLIIGAVPEREDARDAWLSRDGLPLATLASQAKVGTSSLRRELQLRHLRPDLEIVPVRGNVDTRVRRLGEGTYDALVLAAAGLNRLGLVNRITRPFSVDEMCPAAGQGALAIEARDADAQTREAIALIDHEPTHAAVRAERALLRILGGGCREPIAAHATTEDGQLRLLGVIPGWDGRKILRSSASGTLNDPEALGGKVAEGLLLQGAREILQSRQRN
jgi:hydroxymethylbilane synthase